MSAAPVSISGNNEINEPLWAHQQQALDSMIQLFTESMERSPNARAPAGFGLFFDPGTGKTRTAIEFINRGNKLFQNFGAFKRILVLSPINVCRNWEVEFQDYFDISGLTPTSTDPGIKSLVINGQTKVKKLKIIDEAIFRRRDIRCSGITALICNLEVLRSKDYLRKLLDFEADLLIVDESHNFRAADSQQTKGLLSLANKTRPKFIALLSGTPAPQGEIDLWPTLSLLGKTNDSFYIWRKKNFVDKNQARRGTKNYWPEYQVTESGSREIQRILATCSMTARKADVLDLPPLIKTKMYFELSKEQVALYSTMEEFLFAADEDGNELTAENLLVRTLRLQQISCGLMGEGAVIDDNPRLSALKKAIEYPLLASKDGENFIIWTIFKDTYRQIGDLLDSMNIPFGMLTGEVPPQERHEVMQAFESRKLKALIAHPKAGGVGVNLVSASFSIHYSRSFSLVDDLQAEARNYRGGSNQHERITRIDIIAQNTIDEEIVSALQAKQSVQDFILGLKEKRGLCREK